MIDLGISKLAIIGVVALIVIGPERLPKVARMAGSLLGRAQRYLNQVKTEVSREIELEELRRMQNDANQAIHGIQESVDNNLAELNQELSFGHSEYAESDPNTTQYYADPLRQQQKLLSFRRKKLARTSAIPHWYKSQQGKRSHLLSGSARMARHRVHKQQTGGFF